MRRNIVHSGADSLTYEIRGIVAIAHRIQSFGVEIVWENIGDPVNKGEIVAPWIQDLVRDELKNPHAWSYSETQGRLEAREAIVEFVEKRGGAKISVKDILFFNGLGDAINAVFRNLSREARVLGPSPAYSTHSSAEAAHSGYEHLTYQLRPENGWMPNIEEIRNIVRYNDTITGILLINPNNPTGAVYPRSVLKDIVEVAREFDLMLICDEIYCHMVYGGAEEPCLSSVLGEVPALIMHGISKEIPWPGSRCGWIEFYNRHKDANFDRFVKSLFDSKMLEVCSTSLPQSVLPKIYLDPRFKDHLTGRAKIYEKRAKEVSEILDGTSGISMVPPQGAFYITVVFDEGVLNADQTLPIANTKVAEYMDSLMGSKMQLDKRFVYFLMASEGICTVPLSSFCTKYQGFRTTLLETDDAKRVNIYQRIRNAIEKYLAS